MLGKIARGENPIAEKKEQEIKDITLRQAFNDYLAARKSFKKTTAKDYERVLKQIMSDWLNKPLINISKDLIQKTSCKVWRN